MNISVDEQLYSRRIIIYVGSGNCGTKQHVVTNIGIIPSKFYAMRRNKTDQTI